MTEESLFSIELEPLGDESGGELRVKNLYGTEVERRYIVDRGDKLSVQADLVEVVHGSCSDDGKPATLVVMDFMGIHEPDTIIQFLPSANNQRFKSANISVTFRDENGEVGGEDGPWIGKISPLGKTAINPTERHVELKRSANATAQGGAGPGSASLGVAWEKSMSQEFRDHVTLNGKALFDGDSKWGPKRKANWIMMENPGQKTGIPSQLRTLVLLRRKDMSKFTAIVEIKVEVDFRSSMRMGGSKDKDDPIIFDPRPEAKERKLIWAKERSIDIEALETVKLDDHFLVLDAKSRSDVM